MNDKDTTDVLPKDNNNFSLFLNQLFISKNATNIDFYIINPIKTSKKSMLTDEVTTFTETDQSNFVTFSDVLLGKTETNLDPNILADLRYMFNVKRIAGIYQGVEYEFFRKNDYIIPYAYTYLKEMLVNLTSNNSYINF